MKKKFENATVKNFFNDKKQNKRMRKKFRLK